MARYTADTLFGLRMGSATLTVLAGIALMGILHPQQRWPYNARP